MLAGKGSEVQGAALADLVAIWLGGHHPLIRNESFKTWVDLVLDFVKIEDRYGLDKFREDRRH